MGTQRRASYADEEGRKDSPKESENQVFVSFIAILCRLTVPLGCDRQCKFGSHRLTQET